MKLKKIILCIIMIMIAVTSVPVLDLSAQAATPYYIEVDITNQIVTIFRTKDKSIARQMICSTGLDNTTPIGTFTLPGRVQINDGKEWYYFNVYRVYAKYATRIDKGILFHSIPHNKAKDSSINKKDLALLGQPASHGCIRLRVADAKWIAQKCKKGTICKIFESGERDEELRTLLLQASYTGEDGMTYNQFQGIPEGEGMLGRFSTGDEVVSLQYRLRDLGIFSDEIDGIYRTSTTTAVKQVQSMLGLQEDGIVTNELKEIIYASDAPSAMNVTLEEGMSGPAVKSLQNNLAALKLYDGDMHGVYDLPVTEAVKLFQNVYGYSTDGVATSIIQQAIDFEAKKVESLFAQSGGYDLEIMNDEIYLGRISAEVGIRLRKKATTESDALARLTDGDTVLALKYGDPWSKVQYGSNVGYIMNKYVKYYKQSIARLVYTAPGDDRMYTIGHTKDQYYKGADLPSKIFADYQAGNTSVETYEGLADFATVNTEEGVALNLRATPSTNSEVLATLESGTSAKVILRSTEWTLVTLDGQNGYLLNEYLDFWYGPEDALDPDDAEADAAENILDELYATTRTGDGSKAPVYDVDSDEAKVLGHLAEGITVQVLESINGWNLISYQGHEGYMKDSNLHFTTDYTAEAA